MRPIAAYSPYFPIYPSDKIHVRISLIKGNEFMVEYMRWRGANNLLVKLHILSPFVWRQVTDTHVGYGEDILSFTQAGARSFAEEVRNRLNKRA